MKYFYFTKLRYLKCLHILFTFKYTIFHRTTPCDNSKPHDPNFRICSSLVSGFINHKD